MFRTTRLQRSRLIQIRLYSDSKSIQDVYKKYGETLALPSTPYNTNSPNAEESERLIRSTGQELYRWQSENMPKSSTVIFHDGPPYANGSPHMGHALNKVVKDMINRYHLKRGRRVEYRPGWDCHGLPIEMTTLANLKKRNKSKKSSSKVKIEELTMKERRELCAQTAESMIETQMEAFRGFAVMADWENNIYKTLTTDYVLRQLDLFKKMMSKGLISRKNRPVYWSVESQTALAESELEYGEKISTAITLKYKLKSGPSEIEASLGGEDVYLAIWTTTPWTLPSNQAIAVNPEIEYAVYRTKAHGNVIVAVDRAEEVLGEEYCGNGEALRVKGELLIGMKYNCLMKGPHCGNGEDLDFPILAGAHVTSTSGTGLVHSAPGHGMEDYLMCQSESHRKIDPFSPINDRGEYTADVHPTFSPLIGLDARKNQDKIIEIAQSVGAVISLDHDYKHNVPLDWRSKTPVLVRSTPQFFADISSIKERAIQALDNVQFTPASGVNRLKAFTKSRTEWCISRQRVWGVPIPALYHKSTGELLMNDESVSHILGVIEKRGSINSWFEQEDDISEWLPAQLKSRGSEFRKGYETMDVWFDSGTSWTMLDGRIADYYLEGSDQHRGWFQSSLLTKIATGTGHQAPFKRIITHGFVMDKDGKKMSKSLGNVILPEDVKQEPKAAKQREKLGVDGLRLWIAQTDYTVDVALSPVSLVQLAAVLKKIRLTFKFLLGNLNDYGQSQGANEPHEPHGLYPTDRKALHDLFHLEKSCIDNYDALQFNRVVQQIQNHMNSNLSAFYFDIVKDRLYADAGESRTNVQYVFTQILKTYMNILAPITPMLVQKVWEHCPGYITGGVESPFMKTWVPLTEQQDRGHWDNPDIQKDFDAISKVRNAVLDAMDKGRAVKDIRSSLGSEVYVSTESPELSRLLDKYQFHLPAIFITSQVHINKEPREGEWLYESKGDGFRVSVVPPSEHKCPRCWQYTAEHEESLCKRCANVCQQ